MFYIRADGNTKIGAGHIMRCISIARALKSRGKVTIFITADEESARLISAYGFGILTLNTPYDQMEEELPKLLPILEENEINMLLIDSYFVTDHYLKEIGKKTKIVYLDDLGEHAYPVDMLINYNIYGAKIDYESLYHKSVVKVPRLLLGCDYVPLRGEFQCIDSKVRRSVKDVLISTGGSDPCNVAIQLLEALLLEGSKYRSIQFHIISGAFNKNLQELQKLDQENTNFHLYQNVSHMAELMKKCDVAIAACGSTMYELSALGIPTICYFFADNQKKVAEAFGSKLCRNAGDISKEPKEVLEKILLDLDCYMDSYELRYEMSEKMMQVLDGDGASRIAEQLIKLK